MPYASVAELPATIREKYGSKCSRAFLSAFNSTYAKHGESRAFATAHAAAQRCQRKESSMSLDPAASASQEFPGPKFTIITKALQGAMPEEGEAGPVRRRFKATASSTITDRSGDEIEMIALEKMASQFREGRTIFMNHKWRDVEEAFGLTDSAEIIQRGFDPIDNKPIYDLDIGGVVNTPNPKAVRLADSIDGGFVKLGASVTAIVRKHQRKASGGMKIMDVDVIEASIVGVPDNQRSWAQKAAVAIKGFGHVADFGDDENEEETVSDEVIEKGMDAPETDPTNAEPAEGASDDNEKTEDGLAPVAPNQSVKADGQESTEASDDESETPAEDAPETASDDAPDESADAPVVEKSYDPADVAELVRQTARLAQHIERLNDQVIQKDITIGELQTKLRQYEVDASAVATEVDTAAAVIEKALSQPLRPRAQAVLDDAARSDLFANYPGISEYLNKRRHLTNG